jgi:hypothetical protein
MRQLGLLLFFTVLVIQDCYSQNRIDSLGRRQGIWYLYSSDSLLISKGEYKNNLKNGIWKIYSKNGQLTDSGSFYNNRKIGIWTHWYKKSDYDVLPSYYEYEEDGSVTIKRKSSTIFIDKDSTLIYLKLDSSYKQIVCKCENKQIGNFYCVRYHENGQVYKRKEFLNFAETLKLMETQW